MLTPLGPHGGAATQAVTEQHDTADLARALQDTFAEAVIVDRKVLGCGMQPYVASDNRRSASADQTVASSLQGGMRTPVDRGLALCLSWPTDHDSRHITASPTSGPHHSEPAGTAPDVTAACETSTDAEARQIWHSSTQCSRAISCKRVLASQGRRCYSRTCALQPTRRATHCSFCRLAIFKGHAAPHRQTPCLLWVLQCRLVGSTTASHSTARLKQQRRWSQRRSQQGRRVSCW